MRAFLSRLRPYAPLFLRLMIGVIAISFSMGKVMHGMGAFIGQVSAPVDKLGWGLPVWVAKAVAWGSLVSGFLLILGFASRFAALALGVITALILWKTKLHAGFSGGIDFSLLILCGCVSLMLSGAGRPSIDAKLMKDVG